MPKRILAVVSSAPEYKTKGWRTGTWLGELTHAMDAFEEAGHTVDIASPKGGWTPLDPESLNPAVMDKAIQARYDDRAFMDKLNAAHALADVDAVGYDAIFLAGGHGTMFDFRGNPDLQRLLKAMADGGKPVGAVCHGPAGLLDVTLADGRRLLDGKSATGFSWHEEEKVGKAEAVPFNLEEDMTAQGAKYSKAFFAQGKHVVVDDTLVTGQNPASARGVGDEMVKLLA